MDNMRPRVVNTIRALAELLVAASVHALAVCLLLACASLTATAQNSSDRGTPAESKPGQSTASTYARDKIETVNLANGNLSLAIPLAAVGGRGSASFPITLSYNSKVWTAQHDREDESASHGATVGYYLDHYSAMYDKAVDQEPYIIRLGGGWTILASPGVKAKLVGIDHVPASSCNNYTDGAKDCGFEYALTKMWLTLPDGSQVELRDTATDGAPSLITDIRNGYHALTDRDRGRVWHSFDGSDVTFIRDLNDPTAGAGENTFLPSGWAFLADGTRVRIDVDRDPTTGEGVGVHSKIIDADGNYLTIAATASTNSAVYVDELGRQTTLAFTNGVATVTATGYMGAADRSLTVNTGVIGDNLRSDFRSLPRPFTTGDAMGDWQGNFYEHMIAAPHTDLFLDSEGIKAYGDASGLDVGAQSAVTKLNLLDGRSLTFRYNQYGEVSEIVYPGGGVSQVDYVGGVTTVCEVRAVFGRTLNRRVSERRTLTDGSSVDASWVYTRGVTTVGSTSYPSVSVVSYKGSDTSGTGAPLSSENHVFYALDAEYRPCGGPYTGTGNEYWTNAREFRTETQTGTGTVVTVKNWEQRATVSWANDVGSSVNAYAQQHGVDTFAVDDPRVTWEETTLEDLKTKRVEYGYDQFNNVTSTKEYDFYPSGSTPPSTPLRQTVKRYIGDVVQQGDTPSYNGYCYTNLNPLDPACGAPPSDQSIDPTVVIHQKHLLLSEEVKDGAGNREAYSDSEYDNYTEGDGSHQAVAVNSGMTMYDGARFSAFDPSHQPRGSVTRARSWIEGSDGNQPACTSSVCAASYSRYDNAGQIVSVKDPLGHESFVSYADDYGDGTNPGGTTVGAGGATFAHATVTTNALGQVAKIQYDFTLGAVAGVRDANGVVTRTEYDQVGRPLRTTAALGLAEQSVSEMIYPTLSSNVAMISKQLDSTRWLASKTEMDGFDRPVLSATAEDGNKADAASFTIFTETIYDALGRVKLVTNPYRLQAASTDGWTRTTYDLASRVTEVATFAGGVSSQPPDTGTGPDWTGSVTTTYASEQTTVVDQANKQRRSTVDGLGRLVSVDEMMEYPSASIYATTTYAYDARGNLKAVTQGEQTRSFTYDGLSRLKSAINPELCQQQTQCAPVPVTYTYDLGGNLYQKTDARSITTTYQYDAINRITSRTYSDNSTPQVNYFYDSQALPTGAPAFERGLSAGRLVAVTYGGGTLGSYTGQYDATGRPKLSQQVTDTGTTDGVKTYVMAYSYDLAGNLRSETYPSGRVVATEYDAAGRVAGVRNPATGLYYAGAAATDAANRVQYVAGGAAAAVRLGNGLWEHTSFNSRLQPIQIGLGATATDSSTLRLDYTYGVATGGALDATKNNGNTQSQTVTVPGVTTPYAQTYTYDAMNRLQSAEETVGATSNWKQVYSYDRYGNRTLDAGTTYPAQLDATNNPAISHANNRITSAGYAYDAAGNLLCDPTHQCTQGQTPLIPYYAYDAENKMTGAGGAPADGGASYSYDGDGRRVKKVVGSVTTVFVYDAAGKMVAEYSSGQPQASGTSYLTVDTIGSTRVVTGQNQEVKGRYDYLPFGEEVYLGRTNYGGSDDVRQKFTGYEQDKESNLDFAQTRMYAYSYGRFTSPDSFTNDTHTSTPQSWNLYAYVMNNPLKHVDPKGQKATYTVVFDPDTKRVDVYISASYGIYTKSSQISNKLLKDLAAAMQKTINDKWNGGTFQKDGYTFNVNVNVTVQAFTQAHGPNDVIRQDSSIQNVVEMINGTITSSMSSGQGDQRQITLTNPDGTVPDTATWSVYGTLDKKTGLLTGIESAHEFTHGLATGDPQIQGSSTNITAWNTTAGHASAFDYEWVLGGNAKRPNGYDLIDDVKRRTPQPNTANGVNLPTPIQTWTRTVRWSNK
jgi:RHS repeat-associated protein